MARPALEKAAHLLQERTGGHPRIVGIVVVEGEDEPGNWRVEATVEGLSPTLHAIIETLGFDLEDSIGPSLDARECASAEALRKATLTAILTDHAQTAADLMHSIGQEFGLARHEEAARVARTLGIPAAGARRDEHGHVRIDRWVAEEIRRRHEVDAGHLGREAMAVLARCVDNDADDAEWLEYDGEAYDVESTIVWTRGEPTPLVTVSIDLPHGNAFFNGHELTLPDATLPETVLAAAAGRRLGEVAETRTALDGRIVRTARTGYDLQCVVIELEPDPVPFA